MKLDPSAFIADPELIQALKKRSTAIDCKEDRTLFRQGEDAKGLYILDSGEADLIMTSATGQVIASVQASAGSLLGLPGLVGNEPYSLTAHVHGGAKLSYVVRDDFTALMQAEPLLSLKILQVLAAEVRSARRALIEH
jgi:CRP-like cAMP-binding protein